MQRVNPVSNTKRRSRIDGGAEIKKSPSTKKVAKERTRIGVVKLSNASRG